MSEENYRERREEQQKRFSETAEGRICRSCSHINDAEAMFCEECGAGFDSIEKPCPVCGEMNSGVYCVFCGSNTAGFTCVKCNTLQYTDFCLNCGTPLSDMAREMEKENEEPAELQVMSEQEAHAIIQELNDSLTPEMQKEFEKKRQRLILLKEREYFDEREKRIEDYKSSRGIKVKMLSAEDMEQVKKTVERLRGFVAEESERVDEVVKVREETARKEEEERQRLEKERREREIYNNRIAGIWISTDPRWIETMKLTLSGNSLTGSSHWKTWGGGYRECVFTLAGKWDGNNFQFHSTQIRNISGESGHFSFCGTVNASGTVLNGYFIDNSKERKQQIFVKQ
ncbi:MAG TPA: hypothetical protein PKZ64_17560 [Spirochaetota bacterium]|nr:hypothetical protein [Spirochaetota bacterium]HPR38694.1 hypothetical protein [Spirochaetota bacterium]